MTTAERIPIWLHEKKLWISDADRRTTCADVVATLTGHGSDYAVAVDGCGARAGSTMVADPGVRVLKIWQSLRPDQKLCLQRTTSGSGGASVGWHDEDDAGSEMSGYRGAQRKRRREVVKYASRTVHPKRLSNTQAAEELLKLILEQSDTIRAQLKKLQDRDKKIEKIETETHKTRSDALGSNYLLDAYLGDGGGGGDSGGGGRNGGGSGGGDDKEEKDSGITEGASMENEDDDDDDEGSGDMMAAQTDTLPSSPSSSTLEAIGYLERIVKINKKLYEHEERMIRLYVNVERCRDRDQLLDELRKAEVELADTERMYRENALLIRNTDTELRSRLGFIEQLQYEAAIVDSENEYLMGFIEYGRQQSLIENHKQQQHQHHHHHQAATCRVLDTLV
ncbi:uncharacterized protein LOC112686573 [Sipha flava]|uniref:Uncharacterized protein LOC112686573 n=1 Tax=Sipha flava TaxID=143950 RepID=A0A2S2QXZ8_9HEMI|nr:uncharacterized protein LOC112686573 [Sipha flava]XP_025414711.1 uncharacterized protein LOC112686573 [Sipha flava]